MAIEGDKARVTKQQWRTVVISMAAVAFSATAGLEPPLRNLITFARAGRVSAPSSSAAAC